MNFYAVPREIEEKNYNKDIISNKLMTIINEYEYDSLLVDALHNLIKIHNLDNKILLGIRRKNLSFLFMYHEGEYYEMSKESIISFLKYYYIYDENDNLYSLEQFKKIAFEHNSYNNSDIITEEGLLFATY